MGQYSVLLAESQEAIDLHLAVEAAGQDFGSLAGLDGLCLSPELKDWVLAGLAG